ncbi:MAG: transposase [Deltaproteobacteria bacterium]|nr:transposase [Deltaproteobacteria bacterium]
MVWAPKYQIWILCGNLHDRIKNIFKEISKNHNFTIDILEIAEDHVNTSFPPRYSIFKMLGLFKSISDSVIFKKHSEVK